MRPILRVPAPATSYSTPFDLTESPISESGMWKVGGSIGFYRSPQTANGRCFGEAANPNYDDNIAHLMPGRHAVPVNHRVGGRAYVLGGYTPPDSHEIGFYLRMAIGIGPGGNKVRGYEILCPPAPSVGAFQIICWLGTINDDLANFNVLSPTIIGGGLGTVADDDLLEASIIGSQIRCYKNGVEFANLVDTTWSDGNPGMGYFIRPGGTPSSYCLKNWFAQPA